LRVWGGDPGRLRRGGGGGGGGGSPPKPAGGSGGRSPGGSWRRGGPFRGTGFETQWGTANGGFTGKLSGGAGGEVRGGRGRNLFQRGSDCRGAVNSFFEGGGAPPRLLGAGGVFFVQLEKKKTWGKKTPITPHPWGFGPRIQWVFFRFLTGPTACCERRGFQFYHGDGFWDLGERGVTTEGGCNKRIGGRVFRGRVAFTTARKFKGGLGVAGRKGGKGETVGKDRGSPHTHARGFGIFSGGPWRGMKKTARGVGNFCGWGGGGKKPGG